MESCIILDIETSPLPWDEFDDVQHEYLLRNAETVEEQEKKKSEMALAPFTGMIVCIGLIHMKRGDDGDYVVEKKVCLVRDRHNLDDISKDESGDLTIVRSSELRMLGFFWNYLRQAHDVARPHYVSFNGRGFDMPFLMLRSAALGIRPSVNLMNGSRWNYKEYHTDLLDELTFFAPQQQGATRRFNLDFYTKAFGIASPKSEGVDGSKVATMYEHEDYVGIAEYCMRDIEATWLLFRRWREFLKM
jgi:DNA polymerase elongation subunit (family B)